MRGNLYAAGNITRIEGPLIFLKRSVNVGLNEAVAVIGRDRRPLLPRDRCGHRRPADGPSGVPSVATPSGYRRPR